MKRSKFAAILAVLLAASMFGAACSKKETTKKKSGKKSKTEDKDKDDDDDDDDDDETKKTKKTKETSEETTEAPTETTEDTTTTTTTAKESTTRQTAPSITSDNTTNGTRPTFDPLNQNPPTQNYKKISADEFKSKTESMGWVLFEDEPEDLDDEETACIYAYDENMEIVIIYTQYKSADVAAEEYEGMVEAVDESNQYNELLDSVVTDNTIIALTEDEYVVIIYLDEVEIYAYTDSSSASIQKVNQALQTLGYPVD